MRDAKVLSSFPQRQFSPSFTLIEMLVACAILVIILAIVLQMTNQVSHVWSSSTSKIQAFQGARSGFDAMTRRLSQATLNTYYDYYQYTNGGYVTRTTANSTNFVPTTYDRVSDLHFISGQSQTMLTNIVTQTHAIFFQAPLGYSVSYTNLDNGLNACGYYLQFDAAATSIPAHITNSATYTPRYRYRLMEMLQPTENLAVYSGAQNDWFATNVTTASTYSRVVAENVIALVLLPKLPTSQDSGGTAMAPAYNYNSRIPLGATSDTNWSSASPAFPADAFQSTNSSSALITSTRHNQLPPLIHVVMITIDEQSAIKLQQRQGTLTTPPPAINLGAITPSLFTNAANLNSDILAVENICNAKPGNLTTNTIPLNYRIFTSDVTTRESKWSNN